MPVSKHDVHQPEHRISRSSLIAAFVWFSGALFYLYEYLVRVAPSVMMDELELAFHVSKGDLAGSLATYYYIYAPMQLLVGVLFDRYGGKRLLVPATLVIVLGCFLATLPGYGLWLMTVARFLMGLGSAFGFVGAMYLAGIWYPAHRLALLAGLTTALGMFGGIIGESVMSGLVDIVGWEHCFSISAIVGVVLAVILLFVIPKAPSWELKRRDRYINSEAKEHTFLSGLKIVLRNRQTWVIGLVGAFLFTTVSLFAELWGIPYIVNVLEVKKTTAAGAVSMVFLGFIVGGPIIGWLSDHWMNRKKPLFLGSLAASIVFGLIFIIPDMSITMMYLMLFVAGVVSSAQVVCFVAGIESNPAYLKGTSVAVVNMMINLVGGGLQNLVGWLLAVKARGHAVAGSLSEALNTGGDYRMCLMVIPILMLAGAVFCLFIKHSKREKRA